MNQALDAPGISARHRARLFVLGARTYSSHGELERPASSPRPRSQAATEAADNWAIAWALHVLTIVTTMQGQLADALPLFDRALAVTEADPALTDLRLLLQINKAMSLAALDRYEEAFASVAPGTGASARQLGAVVRLAQAQTALGQLSFDTGRWDDFDTGGGTSWPTWNRATGTRGGLQRPRHRRGHLLPPRRSRRGAPPPGCRRSPCRADREPRDRPAGARAKPGPRASRSLLPEALAVLTAGFADNTEELEEIEDLLADAVRLAMKTGDIGTAQSLAGHAAALAAESEIPHRQANALYCRGLLDHDATQLLTAAERYDQAGRPLLRAQALEAAAEEFIRSGDRGQARAAFTRAVEVYGSLGAAADVAKLQAGFRAHGIRRGPHAKHRQATAAGIASRPPKPRSPRWWRQGCRTQRSPPSCCCPGGRSRPMSRTS